MQDKHFLIVGGSSGIGLAIVRQLLAQGAQLTVLSRSAEALDGLAVQHIQVDVLSEDFSNVELPKQIDGLVYCPGSINLKPFRALKPDQFRKDFEINVIGAVKVLQATQRALKAAESASIVLFSTVAVGQGMPFHASIAASKGAVEALTRTLAAEMAPRIRVNCIAPSLTDTPLAGKLLANDDKKAAAANRHPLKSIGQPEDMAQLAIFLLSSQSQWISGQVIGVDGGLSTLRV
ncbi:MAG: SDR family oxidoreductase [Bacteroidota bacterium]